MSSFPNTTSTTQLDHGGSIIKRIFKSLDSNDIINSFDELILLYPQFKKELVNGKSLISDSKDRIKFDEKIETIKKNALKDFTTINNESPITNNQQINSTTLNLYITTRSMIEFNNQFQRKYLKDLFQPPTTTTTTSSSSSPSNNNNNDSNKTQLLKVLNELSSFHNFAPLSFQDMIYRDYSKRYIKMFSPYTCKDQISITGNNKITIVVPVFKLGNENDISQLIQQSYIDIQNQTKHLQIHHSNQSPSDTTPPPPVVVGTTGTTTTVVDTTTTNITNNILLTIFKSVDISKIINTIDQLILVYPIYKNSLITIKELMSSKEGQKGISVKIETIKRNAVKLIMDETILKDRKQVLESDLYNKYLELRLIVEFNFMYQRKLLKEHHIHKLQSLSSQSKRMNDLSIFHNSFPLYIYDLAKRDFGRFDRIAKCFNFTIDGQPYTIPLFKLTQQVLITQQTFASIVATNLQSTTTTTQLDQNDISDVIQSLFYEVYQLVQKFKQQNKQQSPSTSSQPPLLTSPSSTTNVNTNDDGSQEEEDDDEDDEDNEEEEDNETDLSGLSDSDSSTTTSTSTTSSNVKTSESIILRNIFKCHEIGKIIKSVDEMITIYPEYKEGLQIIKDIMLGKDEGNRGLETKIETIKRNAIKDIREEMGTSNNNNHGSSSLLYNKYVSFRLMVEINWIFQRKRLREYIQSDPSKKSITSKLFNDLSTFHNLVPLFFYDLVNKDYRKFEMASDYILKLSDSNTITIPVFKLSNKECISSLINSLFNEIQQLANQLKLQPTTLSIPVQQLQQQPAVIVINAPTTISSSTTTTTTTSTTTTSSNNSNNIVKESDQVILNIFKIIFDYKSFDKDLFYDNVMSMKRIYQKYSGSILSIRETIVNNKRSYNEFLDGLLLIKKNIQIDLDGIGITGNDNIEIISRLFSYRSLISFNFFYQRVQLKERLETINASHDTCHDINKKLNELQSNSMKYLYKFDLMTGMNDDGSGSGSGNDNQVPTQFNDPNLLLKELTLGLLDANLNNNNKKNSVSNVTIRSFKFGGEEISTFINYLFIESRQLVMASLPPIQQIQSQQPQIQPDNGSINNNGNEVVINYSDISPQKQVEDSISENRKQNKQLQLEIEYLKEQINNLKKEGAELDMDINNNKNSNSCVNSNSCTTSV